MEKKEIIDDLLTRGVGDFIDPASAFRKKLETNPTGIVIKLGMDPTRPDIHVGHAVILRKLRKFQDLGCKVIFLIGDFTAQIGDPTGKSKIRPELNQAEVEANMKTYLEQAGKILKTDPAVFSWIRNSDWFVGINDIIAPDKRSVTGQAGDQSIVTPPLPASDILNKSSYWVETRMQKGAINSCSVINLMSILRHLTYSRIIERDMFQDRIAKGEPIFMHEMLYPIFQGIDSDIIAKIYGSCDLEVGGTDQHFNMLVGRDVMQMAGKEPQAVLSFKLLEGTDGKEKMSKSLDNYVGITDEPADMYGKVMSIPDSSIVNYFELCTYTPLADIEEIKANLGDGKTNPKNIKMQLARQITEEYHGKEKAMEAEQAFTKTFSKGEIPQDMENISVDSAQEIADTLVQKGFVASKSEFTRLMKQNAITNLDTSAKAASLEDFVSGAYRIGAHRFIRIIIG